MSPLRQLIALAAFGLSAVDARAFFAHYMIGGIDSSTDHAERDIQDAIAVGFDGFAMNMGSPGASWLKSTVDQLFDAANGTDFGLFFSFDTLQHSSLVDHLEFFKQYRDHPNYMRAGADNFPIISSFGGYDDASDWAHYKSNSDIYLIPNLDDTNIQAYYHEPSEHLSQFNEIVDGYFSWESAWPTSTGKPANVSSVGDQAVMSFAHDAGKSYMMGISPVQYKDMTGSNWYRIGEANLPQRMEQILDLQPDFVEFISWNDGGESHYLGNLWEEAYTTAPEILEYANTDDWPHDAWQPLVTSFINAYKAGVRADEMEAASGNAVGSMWYRGMLKSCTESRPSNADAAIDSVNYAIVVPASSEGYTIRVSSGGEVLSTVEAKAGLNYAAVEGMQVGAQKVELLDSSGNVVMRAASTSDVTDSSKCNFNFNVAGP
ncbi:glycoside hydrolase [Aspergillus germanicus]